MIVREEGKELPLRVLSTAQVWVGGARLSGVKLSARSSLILSEPMLYHWSSDEWDAECEYNDYDKVRVC